VIIASTVIIVILGVMVFIGRVESSSIAGESTSTTFPAMLEVSTSSLMLIDPPSLL
jgi:membrane protein CcdC involved in cytochrome C biogenesis